MTQAGIQISSVREFLQNPDGVLDSFRKVRRTGCRTIQIQWISPEVPAEFIRDALVSSELSCIGTQDYYDEVVSGLDEIIRMNDLWGGTYICVSGIPARFLSPEGCLIFARELSKLSNRLEEAGKILIFHPRYQEFTKFGGRTAVEILLDNTPDNFQVELDVFHVKKAGLDPVDWIYKVKGRMDLVHFKDMALAPDGSEYLTPVGQGLLDWQPIFQACIKTGVKYCFAEQETWQKDPFECLKESYEFIAASGIK